ncbi:MAG: adenylate/guanylate cyclase domain-containing protein [Pseudomonadota bacterium]
MTLRVQRRRFLDGRYEEIVPEPRNYAAEVTLIERRWFDLADHQADNPNDVEEWLLSEASVVTDLHALFEAFMCRLNLAGLGVERASLHVGTLHPQLYGYAWNWSVLDGISDENQVAPAILNSPAYRKNPLSRAIDTGKGFRLDVTDAAVRVGSSVLKQLHIDGFKEYVTEALSTGSGYHNAVTLATRQVTGFSDPQFRRIRHLLRLFALHVERHSALRIARNIASTYLGEQAGTRVSDGTIKRGAGDTIHAIIWASDLRGFTSLSQRLKNEDITAVLNCYFAILADAAMAHGGEVLKFIGDGLLVVFELSRFESPAEAAQAALNAAQAALRGVERLNADPDALLDVLGWRPLKSGIALHKGRVFFGNVGSDARLDFTVIGSAVNATARIEGLCKELKQPLLMSGEVRKLLEGEFESHGAYELRGQSQPTEVFSPNWIRV